MGNWNRRWLPRKKHNYYEFPPSPPPNFSQAIQENSVPSWERNFCMALGIPWHRIVTAKKYMSCYDNVVKWEDWAGQEAFEDAKRRYWDYINGLPPHAPPPDPDMYIDEVDWDSTVDPELILDLDREYFNPNEAENSAVTECTLVWEDNTADNGENAWGSGDAQGPKSGGNPWESGSGAGPKSGDNPWESGYVHGAKTGENPWESGNAHGAKTGENPWESGNAQDSKTGENQWGSGNVQGSKTFEDVGQTWNEWDNPVNTNDNDPWEKNCSKTQWTVKKSAWGGCGNDSWGCVANTSSNLWHKGGRNSWNNTRANERWNQNYGGSRWNRSIPRGGGTTAKDRRWGEYSENSSWGERTLDHGRPGGRGGDNKSFYNCSRKREGTSQHVWKYKTSRFHGDEQRGTAYNWKEEKDQRRVTFGMN